MQVAVVAVRVVQRAADGEISVVAVGHRLVAAARSMRLAALHRRAGAGADAVHLEPVLVGVTLVRGVEVSVVEVVGVVPVPHGAMPAAGAVPVLVAVMRAAGHVPTGSIVALEGAAVNPGECGR